MRLVSILFLLGLSLSFMAGCFWTPRSVLQTNAVDWPGDTALGYELSPWWTTFEDETLNRLTNAALAENLEIQEALARIRQAEAAARQSGARLFPTLDAQGSLGAEREDSRRDRSAGLGALLRWELDLWGRLKAGREASEEALLAARADALGLRLILSAAVAETYLAILEEHAQLALLERQAATNQTLLELTQLRLGQGEASIVDVLQQREQLASTLALVPLAEASLYASRHQLAVLLGRSPEEAPDVEPKPFPEPAPATKVSTSRLLHHPDLRARRHRILALDHQVGQAVAERLPQVTLSASSVLVDGTDLNALVSSAIAELVGPLFDAGERRSEVKQRIALLEEALHGYGHAYLEAVSELQTALVNEDRQVAHLQLLRSQLGTAERVLLETLNRYSQGLTDYLPVLAAVERVQELERALITNERQRLRFRIQRHRALGGA